MSYQDYLYGQEGSQYEGMHPDDCEDIPMTEQEWEEMEAAERQSVEWLNAGKCAGCGSDHDNKTFLSDPKFLYCNSCMNNFTSCIDDAKGD